MAVICPEDADKWQTGYILIRVCSRSAFFAFTICPNTQNLYSISLTWSEYGSFFLLINVHGEQLWSCRDGHEYNHTIPGQAFRPPKQLTSTKCHTFASNRQLAFLKVTKVSTKVSGWAECQIPDLWLLSTQY